jgi:hypothetical protein
MTLLQNIKSFQTIICNVNHATEPPELLSHNLLVDEIVFDM